MLLRSYKVRKKWTSANPLPAFDWVLWFLVVGLTFLSGLLIYSVELLEQSVDAWQHWLFGIIGLAIGFIISRFPYKIGLKWHWLTYVLTNLVLVAVIFVGIGGDSHGSQSWINIGSLSIQPSEFAKLGLIITLAAILQDKGVNSLSVVCKVLAIAALPWTLIMLQPDLGTGLVLGAITLGMLYWANMPLRWVILLLSPLISAILFNVWIPVWIIFSLGMGAIAWLTLPHRQLSTLSLISINLLSGKLSHLLWNLLKDYQKDRFTLFLNPETNPLGGGYQLIQSRIAIGSGQLWGRGLFEGTQTQLNFIPEQHTDFIFSAVGEELGFIGSIIVLMVFWLIFWRLIKIASQAKDNFGSLLAIGVLSMIAFQVIVNISMTIGLAPITGIPLPWMSYGRSALLTNFMAIGLVQAVAYWSPQNRLKY